MSNIGPATIMLVAGTLFCGSACAMGPSASQSPQCRVSGGEKLPAGSGGAAALCAAVERALAASGSNAAVKAEVRVLSASMLAATLTAGGRTLPEQRFASMDRDLDGRSFERFAEVLADQAARARR